MTLRIPFLGNFQISYTSETHHAKTLQAMGHRIVPLQEPKATPREIREACRGADMFIWIHTHGWRTLQVEELLSEAVAKGIPVITYHLDLWKGLEREKDMGTDPYWRVLTDFFTVDPQMATYLTENTTIKGHYLPPAVFGPECYMAEPTSDQFDVVFVGSYGYHPEYSYRPKLIDWLRDTYGSRFRHYGGGGLPTVRGAELNQVYANAKVAVGDTLCLNFDYPGYYCADAETAALTEYGWRKYDQIDVGDRVYTINPHTGMGEWNAVEAMNVFPPEAREMLSLESQGHSSLTTLDHRWLLADFRGNMRFRHSREMGTNDRIPVAAPASDLLEVSQYSDAFVELVAWAWTEGCVRRDRYVSIDQSHRANPSLVDRIAAALVREYGPEVPSLRAIRGARSSAWRRASYREGMTTFLLSKGLSDELWRVAPDHRVDPSFILALTADQLRLFVETSVDADGCRSGNGVTFAQKDSGRLDAFEMACALLGVATSRNKAQSGHWIVQLKVRAFTAPVRMAAEGTAKAQVVVHDGAVWCPTTRNGTWLAQRDGRVYFTGNSDRLFECPGRGGFQIFPRIPGVETHFTEDKEIVLYDYNDFDQLKAKIDHYLAHDEEREAIRRAGHERTKAENTYHDRWRHILNTLGLS